MRAQEFQPNKLVIFDIDDTLVHTQTKVHVIKNGQVTKELNSHDFTHYKLQPGEKFDFENFRNAKEFFTNSKPIIPMMNQLKQDISTGNKVVMVTARADFDDKELFLDTFRKYGVDMGRVHVYRAGNMTGKIQTEEKKKIIIRDLLNKGRYTKAIMYDDAEPNLQSFVELKKEYPKTKFYAWHVSLEGEASEYHRTNESFLEDQDDYEIRNYKKLDKILSKLCDMVDKGQASGKDYGMVAAAVLDPDNQIVARLNLPAGNGKRIHAERAAMEAYEQEHGSIPKGSIIITTCSPCSEHMDERYGESCTDLINNSIVKKVYAGYMDPSQEEEHREFNIMETEDESIRNKCKEFASTFLDENFADGKNPQDKGDSKRYHVPTKGSVSSLRKFAKGHSGRAAQLAHWMANMKSGKKK
jgi:pyrimidine deaminase RibD-like protein